MSKGSTALGAIMLCLGLLFSASVIVARQDQAMPSAKESKQKEKTKTDTVTISGTVSAVTDGALTIIDSEKTELTVAVTAETKVTKGGKEVALTDVKANDIVTVEAKKAGDAWTALKISVS